MYDYFIMLPEELKEKEREAWEGIPWKDNIHSITVAQREGDSWDLLFIVVPVEGRRKVLSLDPRKKDAIVNISVFWTIVSALCGGYVLKKYAPETEEDVIDALFYAINCLKLKEGNPGVPKDLASQGYVSLDPQTKYVEQISEIREDGSIYRHKILHGVNLKEI